MLGFCISELMNSYGTPCQYVLSSAPRNLDMLINQKSINISQLRAHGGPCQVTAPIGLSIVTRNNQMSEAQLNG
jgi:hypothetical protein